MADVEFTLRGNASDPLISDVFKVVMGYQAVVEVNGGAVGSETENTSESVDTKQIEFIENLLGKHARRPVAKGQKALIKALIDVSWDEGLSRKDLLKKMGGERENKQLSGLLGAFGRRINGTRGFSDVSDGPRPINAILYAKKDGQWCYRLKPWVAPALDVLYERGQVVWLRDNKGY